jgi:hypothetical protein
MAEGVRRELGGPLTEAARQRLRDRVAQSLQQVGQIVRDAGSTVNRLPDPSRRAIQFLQSIEWEKIPIAADAPPATQGRQVSWPGLPRYVEQLMNQLSAPTSERELEEVRESIARMSRQMEGTIERQKLSPHDLAASSRELRGWLNYFSRPQSLSLYARAMKLARAAIGPGLERQKRFPPPLRIHFRPMRGIYKIRGSRRGSVLTFPTPMIAFDAPEFAELADLVFGTHSAARQRVLERITAEGYQAMTAQLEALSGIVQQTRGAFHDLGESFERVNARYFGGAMLRPRLTWSRSFTGRKFGHYDHILDTVMVSRTLDVGSATAARSAQPIPRFGSPAPRKPCRTTRRSSSIPTIAGRPF